MIAALSGLVSGVLERQRLRSRIHVLEGLLEIKSEVVDRQRQELQTVHARVRSLELTLEHLRLRLPSLRPDVDAAILQELEGVLLEASLGA